jgi:hypothetical protein
MSLLDAGSCDTGSTMIIRKLITPALCLAASLSPPESSSNPGSSVRAAAEQDVEAVRTAGPFLIVEGGVLRRLGSTYESFDD